MLNIRYLWAIVATTLLLASQRSVLAEEPRGAPPPLKPGRSAGVQLAQQGHTALALVGGSAIIAVIIVAATTGNGQAGNNQNNSPIATTTTTQ